MRLLLVAVFLAFLTPTAKADTGSPYDNIDPVRASKIKHHTAKAKTTRRWRLAWSSATTPAACTKEKGWGLWLHPAFAARMAGPKSSTA